MIDSFSFTPFPSIYFGEGEFFKLVDTLKSESQLLLVTGGNSIQKNGMLDQFTSLLKKKNISSSNISISSEPSPESIDQVVAKYRCSNIDKVIAIGGGSVLDAGKAIAAMLPLEDSISHYLEGVGSKQHPGDTVSFIAIPTTAGTGSEATKNAVISSVGKNGFKKSLRHDNFIPDIAVIDPTLMISCPESLTAACGLDAITQLLESYVSSKANPITDALALGALQKVIPAFEAAVKNGKTDLNARAAMVYGALISGITLANAGLGIVHGFASPIGGFFDIPHGVVCGALLPAATKINIELLLEADLAEHKERLQKHLKVVNLLSTSSSMNDVESLQNLSDQFLHWVNTFEIPRLSKFGIKETDFERIISATNQKNNPIELSQSNLKGILQQSL